MDNTLIRCDNSTTGGSGSLVGSSRLFVEASPPSAPTDVMVTFNNPGFIIQWNSATVGSFADISRYSIDISGPDDGCGGRSAPQLVSAAQGPPYQYTCPMASVGGTYTITVSAECGILEGTALEVTLTPQVPSTPLQFELTPEYNESTRDLLKIESQCNTVPSVTLAETSTGFTLEEEPTRYLFTYSDGTTPVTQTVESDSCTGGVCRDVFIVPSGGVPAQYEMSVAAENRIGVGELSPVQTINTINDLLAVEVDVVRSIVLCRFLGGFTGTAECQIEYSTQEDFSGSVVDTGSSTSGDTVTVTLTATLEGRTTYYFLVTAAAEGVCVRVEGFFQTDCLVSELGMVDTDNQNCEGFAGSVQIPAGRACFTGTVPSSIAVYACTCTCDSQYRLEGVRTRVCQRDGTWSGAIPQCQNQCLSLGAAVGITFALTFLVAFFAGLLVAFVIGYCYVQRQILKGRYSPSDSQQPTPVHVSTRVLQGGIELKENISYGPVSSQLPAPQQRAPMYEEVVQTGSIEVKANVAYGPVSH